MRSIVIIDEISGVMFIIDPNERITVFSGDQYIGCFNDYDSFLINKRGVYRIAILYEAGTPKEEFNVNLQESYVALLGGAIDTIEVRKVILSETDTNRTDTLEDLVIRTNLVRDTNLDMTDI